jgi:hypothetical protein
MEEYFEDDINEMLENDEIGLEEAGFMFGYCSV